MKCPVCASLLNRESLSRYLVFQTKSFVVMANPAPMHSWALLVLPVDHVTALEAVDEVDFARALRGSIRAYHRLFTHEPAFNIVVRCGADVGHLHAEIIPKTDTNILGGWEGATDMPIIDVHPAEASARLSMDSD